MVTIRCPLKPTLSRLKGAANPEEKSGSEVRQYEMVNIVCAIIRIAVVLVISREHKTLSPAA